MPEQDPSYHPAVEKIMETYGPDVGRIKDEAAAARLGDLENSLREVEDPATVEASLNSDLNNIVVGEVIKGHSDYIDAMADAVLNPGNGEQVFEPVKTFESQAGQAVADVREVQDKARLAREQEARQRIADLEDTSANA